MEKSQMARFSLEKSFSRALVIETRAPVAGELGCNVAFVALSKPKAIPLKHPTIAKNGERDFSSCRLSMFQLNFIDTQLLYFPSQL